jgi:hypothetical protein
VSYCGPSFTGGIMLAGNVLLVIVTALILNRTARRLSHAPA